MAITQTTTTKGVKLACSASNGTESAPTTDGAVGLALQNGNGFLAKGFTIHVETAGTMTAGGSLKCYLWNAVGGGGGAGQWNPCPDLDCTVAAVASQAFPGAQVVAGDRIMYIPSGLGVASTIHIQPNF